MVVWLYIGFQQANVQMIYCKLLKTALKIS